MDLIFFYPAGWCSLLRLSGSLSNLFSVHLVMFYILCLFRSIYQKIFLKCFYCFLMNCVSLVLHVKLSLNAWNIISKVWPCSDEYKSIYREIYRGYEKKKKNKMEEWMNEMHPTWIFDCNAFRYKSSSISIDLATIATARFFFRW